MGMRGGGNKFKTGSVKSAQKIYGNSKVISAAKSGSHGFKFGGKVVGGMKAVKKARGGAVGCSPFSSAHKAMKGDA